MSIAPGQGYLVHRVRAGHAYQPSMGLCRRQPALGQQVFCGQPVAIRLYRVRWMAHVDLKIERDHGGGEGAAASDGHGASLVHSKREIAQPCHVPRLGDYFEPKTPLWQGRGLRCRGRPGARTSSPC